ncbi:MAG: hypothetical protein A2X64_02720 [Ignavibacteria bacterium GWF2_33_9]|nr:MAG: hypothetical protein A2X64_02720 [Ignavibacteria bacterium GWF2_33_9]
MKYLIYILVFFGFLLPTHAQYWEEIKNLPSAYKDGYFLDIYFLPSNTNYVWACGFSGYVVRSTNYGATWNGTKIPNADHMENVQFLNTNVGYVSGVDGIYKSTDGGVNFFDVTPTDSSGRGFWGSYFTDANNGVLLGGGCDGLQRFYKTTDGGNSWTLFQTAIVSSGLTDCILYTDGTGYAVSSGYLWYTSNAGTTWAIIQSTGLKIWEEEISIFGNSFLLPMAGTDCQGGGPNSGGMNFSTDGGVNWNKYNVPYALFGAALTSTTSGWACGYSRQIYHTSDAGLNWELQNCGIPEGIALDDITFLSPTDGWVCGQGIYKLAPTKFLTNKDSIGFGNICFMETRRDSVKIANLSFKMADLKVSLINNFDNAFSIISPTTYLSQINECDSVGIIIQFAPTVNKDYTAKLRIETMSGDGVTSFIKEIPLTGTGSKSTIYAENKMLIFDSIPCNKPQIVSLKWYSDGYNEQLLSATELLDDKNQITLQTNLPDWVTKLGTTTQFQLLLLDTGWVSQNYKFLMSPCQRDTIIKISAYGVSPIINTIDSLHFVSHCSGIIIDTIPVWNTGNATLTIINSSIVGNPPEVKILGWTSQKTEPVSIPINSSDSVIVQFNPQTLNLTSYYLRLENDDMTLKRGNKNPMNILLVGKKESELVTIKDSVIDFGKICINSTKDSILTFDNLGNIAAMMKMENDIQEPFSMNVPWNFSIEPKDKALLTLKFAPKTSGQFNDSLIFKTGDCNYLKLYISGIGIESNFTVTPNSFSATIKSGTSKDFNIVLKNTGNDDLKITNYRLVPATSDFNFTLAPSLTQTLNIGQQMNFVLTAISNTNAFYKGQICFDAEGLCPVSMCVPVELISINRYMTMKDSINFGNFECSALMIDTIWVKNSGAVADTITSISLDDETYFKILGTTISPNTIPEGDSLGIIIKFETSIEGVFTAQLNVQTLNPDGQTLTTKLRGEFKKTDFSISKLSIDFGQFEMCDLEKIINFDIQNNGTLDDDLIVYDISIPTGYTSDFNSPEHFAGNDSKQFSVIFTPGKITNAGIFNGHLYFYSQTCHDTLKLDFQAEIIDPKLTYSSSAIDFGSVWIGDVKIDSLLVSNYTNTTRKIESLIPLSLQYFKMITNLPIIVPPNSSIPLYFSFSPTIDGTFTDKISFIESSICKDTLDFTLKGTTPKEIYETTVNVGNYKSKPGDSVYIDVFLSSKIERLEPDSINVQLSFDKYLIYPVKTYLVDKNGNLNNLKFDYKSGVISFTLNSTEALQAVSKGDTIIRIRSYVLASSPYFTPIILDNFNIATNKNVSIIKIDGSLEIDPLCSPEVEHHLITIASSNIQILAQPIGTNTAEIKFEYIEANQVLEIYDILGNLSGIIPLEKGSYTKEISFDNYTNGIYYLYLKPLNQAPQKLLKNN